ncbi:TolC family protein [Fusobacterium russii]|uniref:TolC family protein n=1 Tax=Fusobacterium russii TaxID=854 RepID=UPI0003A7AEAA|nr:TolC family protein [Fusobacterium russii]
MRGRIFLTTLIINLSIFFYSLGNEISVDDIFSQIENSLNSYELNLYKNNEEKINNLIKDNKLGDFNGLEFSSNFNAIENSMEDRLRKYDKTLQNKLAYGSLFLNYNYVENRKSYISYGVEKNIKDLFYSKYKSEVEVNTLSKKLNKVEYLKNIEKKKLEFLDLYQNILDMRNELMYLKEASKYYKNEVKRVKEKFNLGMEAKISLEAAEIELEDMELKIVVLNKNLEALYQIGKNDYGINLQNYTLKDINYKKVNFNKLIEKYMILDLNELELNLKVLNERTKYNKYDSFMPDIILGFERIDRRESYGRVHKGENIFSVKFSKKLFSTDTTYKNSKIEEEKLKENLKEKKKEIENEKIKLIATYEELEKSLEINRRKLDIVKKRYEIKKKENELNRASYLDVIDTYRTYLAQEIETKKIKNNLYAFMYKIDIKATYEVKSE